MGLAIRRMGLATALALGLAGASARAQETDPPAPVRSPLDQRQEELRALEEGMRLSEAQRKRIEAELEIVRTDRTRLTAALLAATQRVQTAESRVAEAEKRLDASLAGEKAIQDSLAARRDTIANLLAALQRLGHRPPPALLVKPDDVLGAIRAAILLGGLVPELRVETEILAADLAELTSLRRAVSAERDRLRQEAGELGEERQRLAALTEARRADVGESEKALQAERERARALARQALDLKDLIARMENEISGARRGADAARRADEDRRQRPGDAARGASPFANAGRLTPAISFANARGLLPRPVVGEVRKSFGAPDGFGGVERGLSISARPRAVVSSPTDGWVAFSGPYRTYGQLLIINAGDGYYVVLAGLARINVEVGQFVLAGEAVGAMGETSGSTAAAIAIGAKQPILYVEFRKDGVAIDPDPWWAKSGA
jgi:septal ring factor EnvC (AmiA/AmiB activator)